MHIRRLLRLHGLLAMEKENVSQLWIVAFYFALSAICVTANNAKSSQVEVAIAGEEDAAIQNNLLYSAPIDFDQAAAESNEEVETTGRSAVCRTG